MSFQEKSLQCADCGITFPFTVQEQELFASRGYTNEPKRCPPCRQARKAQRAGSDAGFGSGARRQLYHAVCATCGIDTEVPFQPRGDRPVYCSDCYRKTKASY